MRRFRSCARAVARDSGLTCVMRVRWITESRNEEVPRLCPALPSSRAAGPTVEYTHYSRIEIACMLFIISVGSRAAQLPGASAEGPATGAPQRRGRESRPRATSY